MCEFWTHWPQLHDAHIHVHSLHLYLHHPLFIPLLFIFIFTSSIAYFTLITTFFLATHPYWTLTTHINLRIPLHYTLCKYVVRKKTLVKQPEMFGINITPHKDKLQQKMGVLSHGHVHPPWAQIRLAYLDLDIARWLHRVSGIRYRIQYPPILVLFHSICYQIMMANFDKQ